MKRISLRARVLQNAAGTYMQRNPDAVNPLSQDDFFNNQEFLALVGAEFLDVTAPAVRLESVEPVSLNDLAYEDGYRGAGMRI